MNGLSKYYIKKIISCFADEMTATETSRKLKVNRNTVNKYYRIIREAIADYQNTLFCGQPKTGLTSLYYLYWHRSNGITTLYDDTAITFYVAPLNGRAYIGSEEDEKPVFGDGKQDPMLPPSLELIALDEFDEPRMHLSAKNQAAGNVKSMDLAYHFYLYAKEKLTKFYGVKEEYSLLYLKELEFRFNNRDKDLSQIIWKILPHHSPEWAKTSRYRK